MFADDKIEDLDYEAELLKSKLYVVDRTTQFTEPKTYLLNYQVKTTPRNDWKVYKGFNEISKIDFFKLVNNQELLDLCVKAEKKNKIKSNIAKISFTAGCCFAVCSIACMLFWDPDKDSDTLMWISTGALGASLIGFGLYEYEITSMKVPNIPIEIALNIAENYNKKLAISFKESF